MPLRNVMPAKFLDHYPAPLTIVGTRIRAAIESNFFAFYGFCFQFPRFGLCFLDFDKKTYRTVVGAYLSGPNEIDLVSPLSCNVAKIHCFSEKQTRIMFTLI